MIDRSKEYIGEYWFENLNLRGDYKKTILTYIKEKHPEHYDDYTKIYIKGDKSYWRELSEEIEEYCQTHNINYTNFFYHEKLVADKEARKFEECTFKKCTLNEAVFRKCSFRECTFEQCNVCNIKLKDTKIYEVKIESCKAIGINWAEALFANVIVNCPLEFRDSDISYSSFNLLKLSNTSIVGCKAEEVDFRECDLSESNLKGSDFNRSTFYETNLFAANFAEAINYNIDPLTNKVARAKFSLPEALNLLECLEVRIV
jgi:hypothetical protein